VREWINKKRTDGRFENKNLNELVDKNANTKSMHEKAKASDVKKTFLSGFERENRWPKT